jgi:hypothetical protein
MGGNESTTAREKERNKQETTTTSNLLPSPLRLLRSRTSGGSGRPAAARLGNGIDRRRTTLLARSSLTVRRGGRFATATRLGDDLTFSGDAVLLRNEL